MTEFEITFLVFGKKFRTTLLAESESDANEKIKKFILSKSSISSCSKKKSDWNELMNDCNDMLNSLSKK